MNSVDFIATGSLDFGAHYLLFTMKVYVYMHGPQMMKYDTVMFLFLEGLADD